MYHCSYVHVYLYWLKEIHNWYVVYVQAIIYKPYPFSLILVRRVRIYEYITVSINHDGMCLTLSANMAYY